MARKPRVKKPPDLRTARTWWLRTYAQVVHKKKSIQSAPLQVIDQMLADDLKISSTHAKGIRNGWDNVKSKHLEILKRKLGLHLPCHPVEIMGHQWETCLKGTMALINEEHQHAKKS